MIEPEQLGTSADADYVPFLETGDAAKGSFRCAECSYGVVVTGGLPLCPMCGSTAWEVADWSPFGRSGQML